MAARASPSPARSADYDSSGSAQQDALQATPSKTRKQTAIYPNVNSSNKLQKPFSRSAAKRESVMALGSIEHLQHYFTKTGIAARKNPLGVNSGLVPAIGSPSHVRGGPSLGNIEENDLPPSPSVPVIVRPPYPAVEKTYEVDSETIKAGMIQDLEVVSRAWGFAVENGTSSPNLLSVANAQAASNSFDVLATLKLTTRAIRSVRNYLVSLPDDSALTTTDKRPFRPPTFRPAPAKRVVSNTSSSDPLARVRKSALDVLIALRDLEESARLPLSDEAYDAQSDHGSSTHDTLSRTPSNFGEDPDASFSFTIMTVPGRTESILVWPEEDSSDSELDGQERREVWDQRLVLGSGWLYRQDLKLGSLADERDAVGRYLDSVDDIIFGGPSGERRGWQKAAEEREREARGRSSRRISSSEVAGRISPSPMGAQRRVVSAAALLDSLRSISLTEEPEDIVEEEIIDDDDLPDWAKRTSFVDNSLARVHALLTHLLPVDLLYLLPSPSDRLVFLEALSSGQLLCNAYNTGVRRSKKPWGYINKDSIHDIASLESQSGTGDADGSEKRRTGWTFRRTDNLRLWAAALKLRYMIPYVSGQSNSAQNTPPNGTPSTSPTPIPVKRLSSSEPQLFFDAKLVARKEDGWQDMLEIAVLRWMTAVVEEKRGER